MTGATLDAGVRQCRTDKPCPTSPRRHVTATKPNSSEGRDDVSCPRGSSSGSCPFLVQSQSGSSMIRWAVTMPRHPARGQACSGRWGPRGDRMVGSLPRWTLHSHQMLLPLPPLQLRLLELELNDWCPGKPQLFLRRARDRRHEARSMGSWAPYARPPWTAVPGPGCVHRRPKLEVSSSGSARAEWLRVGHFSSPGVTCLPTKRTESPRLAGGFAKS